MTEPWVASSDATNIQSRIERDGDHYVVNAHKWWTSGAASARCKVAILMGVVGSRRRPVPPALDDHRADGRARRAGRAHAAGLRPRRGRRALRDPVRERARCPRANILGGEGNGFAMAQARLGPGRIHHCMRAIGLAEKALELMCMRAQMRTPFGKPLADQGVVQDRVAESRMEIEQARLLTMKAAWLMDTVGNKGARFEIARDQGARGARPRRR